MLNVSRIRTSPLARRFVEFTHSPPVRVNSSVVITDGRREIEGRIVAADWKVVHTLDTEGGT